MKSILLLFCLSYVVYSVTDCNCDWIHIPGACDHDDGSYCWKVCCGSGPAPGPTPAPGPMPPSDKTTPMPLQIEYSNPTMIGNNGFSGTGGFRLHSTRRYNLMNGGLSFTADISGVKDLVNSNLYIVMPHTLGNNGYYCDNGGSQPLCIELDIYESNGHSLLATTMHTKAGTGSGQCNMWGCRTITYLNGQIQGNAPFQVDVDFPSNGDIIVKLRQGGSEVTVFNDLGGKDGSAPSALINGMQQHGAVIVTGMWTGWVPPNTSGTGDLNGSTMKITDLKYNGVDMGGVNFVYNPNNATAPHKRYENRFHKLAPKLHKKL